MILLLRKKQALVKVEASVHYASLSERSTAFSFFFPFIIHLFIFALSNPLLLKLEPFYLFIDD